MSELTAESYYKEMKEIVDVPNFTKLTNTGISTDYESIFDFAESYFDARIEANEAAKEQETALPLKRISKSTFCFDYIGKVFNNGSGQRVGEGKTEYVEAWDEEHAILLFEKLHPDTPYDKPY